MAGLENLDVIKFTQPTYDCTVKRHIAEFLMCVRAHVPLLMTEMEFCNRRGITDPFSG